MRNMFFIMIMLLTTAVFSQENKYNLVPQISVTGEGKIKITPDIASLKVGIVNSGRDANEVKRLNDQVIERVIKFLKKSGVPSSDFITNNISLYKNYDYDKKKYNYTANQSLLITIKDLTKFDEIMTGINDTGINSIQGLEFSSSKMDEHEKEARKKAILNARQKALDYTTVLGQKVGKAITISDSSTPYYPQPVYKNMALAMSDESAAVRETLAIGEIEINTTVNVSFLLE